MRRGTSLFAFISLGFVTSLAACGGGSDTTGGGDDTAIPAIDAGAHNDGSASHNDAGNTPGNDAATGTDSGNPINWTVAPHPALPTLQSSGGPTIKNAKLVPVFYNGYQYRTQIVDYATKIGGTDFWKANVEEYGLGAASIGTPVDIPDQAPAKIDDSDIQNLLKQKLGTDASWGTPSTDTIYTFFFPTSTTITLGNGQVTACQQVGGWHQNVTVTLNGKSTIVPYAVIPGCANFDGMTGIDVQTASSSHEWLEAVTDPQPLPGQQAAYNTLGQDHYAWRATVGGVENGDMCAQSTQNFLKPPGFDYIVQKAWSNKAAAADKEPCVGANANVPYFNAAADAPDQITVFDLLSLSSFKTQGLKIAVGQSKTVDVKFWSTGPLSSWTVVARDMAVIKDPNAQPNFTFSWDQPDPQNAAATHGQNGDVRKLTITVAKGGSSFQSTAFLLYSYTGTKPNITGANFWPIIVGQN